ncbi:hypothetical protein JAAARDRAFT_41996 [Jaapia argillacea MUCL 33604]|uniref:Uncharacterized protein n=1 Tax=Jaapia argillacea MUCL 33604 TaxID=933084 RepID=A0A067P6L8_9AGAM|nr:hypothetical protein JAAARDRAFT_41996 [Jaapia argillacea MUCL 33604]
MASSLPPSFSRVSGRCPNTITTTGADSSSSAGAGAGAGYSKRPTLPPIHVSTLHQIPDAMSSMLFTPSPYTASSSQSLSMSLSPIVTINLGAESPSDLAAGYGSFVEDGWERFGFVRSEVSQENVEEKEACGFCLQHARAPIRMECCQRLVCSEHISPDWFYLDESDDSGRCPSCKSSDLSSKSGPPLPSSTTSPSFLLPHILALLYGTTIGGNHEDVEMGPTDEDEWDRVTLGKRIWRFAGVGVVLFVLLSKA